MKMYRVWIEIEEHDSETDTYADTDERLDSGALLVTHSFKAAKALVTYLQAATTVAVGEVPGPVPQIDEVEQEACPHCDTIADEHGYCVDVGCQYLGKAVIG